MKRALIVGLGWWGKTLVDSVQNKSNKIQIKYALTQTSSEDAKLYSKANKMTLLEESYEKALQRNDFDAVILATPHSQHVEQIRMAAESGKHIACEKPFTLNRLDALSAVKAVEKNGVTLSVLYNRRFNPVVKEIQHIVKSGALGTTIHVESNFSGDTAIRGATDPNSWRQNPEESPLGSMTSRGLHAVDTLVSFCGEINKVFATSGNRILENLDDMTSCLLWFNNGMTGYIATSNVTAPFWWLKIYGSEATAEMRNYDTLVLQERSKEALIKTFESIDIEKAELESFCDDINNKKLFSIPKNEIINISSFLEASLASTRLGKAISLEDGTPV